MKHLIEKPREYGMKFFTPELFLAFNSPDEDEADRADEAWETASRHYQTRLDSIRDRLPAQVRELSETSYHDAEILACDEPSEPFIKLSDFPLPQWLRVAILSLKEQDRIVTLIYALVDRVRKHAAPEPWPFSKEFHLWLYDEIDLLPGSDDRFLHRILFSDGSVLEIPFESVQIHRFSLPSVGENPAMKVFGRDAWDDPQMDDYNALDPRR